MERVSEPLQCFDEKCRDILEVRQDSSLSITNLKQNRKQFYSRMYKMKHWGLIKKVKEDFVLTSFGKVIFQDHLILRDMIDEYWKFNAFDGLSGSDIPELELTSIFGNSHQK